MMKTDGISDLVQTRKSLLSRLRNCDDHAGWNEFFDTYWRIIYCTALKAGLNDAEAQDVVQETVISVMKSMPDFHYDPQRGTFRAWLLRLTGWRIVDQIRKRGRFPERKDQASSVDSTEIESIVDPNGFDLEANWNSEWEQNLLDAAIERVKRKVDSKQYQLFDLHVVKRWPILKVCRLLKVNPGRVYLTKHRIGKLIKDEVAYLRAKYP